MRTLFSAQHNDAWLLRNLSFPIVEHLKSTMPASTVSGQMANPLAVIAPRPGLCSASYSAVVGFDCSWKDHHTFFSFMPDIQRRHGSFHPSAQL
ncbi:hypothetical protein Tco_0562247 [Tanacetum coccineum]